MLLALIIGNAMFIGITFFLSIILILLAWLPTGIILRVFRVTQTIVPKALKVLVAWIAFVGFLGFIYPEIFSFRAFLGAALVMFIMMGVTAKVNLLDKIIAPLVLIMVLTIGWKHFFPESFRSTVRYAQSVGKRVSTLKDRGSINNETDAATTYAVLLKDVKVLYLQNGTDFDEVNREVSRGTIVRLVSHKNEIIVFDGQGLVEIQMAKESGSYLGGKKYFVEAEYVQIAGPRDIVPKDDSLLPGKKQQEAPAPTTTYPRDSIFTKGIYYIDVKGVTPYNIIIYPSRDGCARYSISSDTYNHQILYSDGEKVQSGPNVIVRHRQVPTFRLISETGDRVRLIVA